MARNTSQTGSGTAADQQLPHLVTIVGRGVPSNFELAVAGELEPIGADPLEEAIIASESVAEGTIDVGVYRFRFSGELINIHVVDWNGVDAAMSPSTPAVHVDYGVATR